MFPNMFLLCLFLATALAQSVYTDAKSGISFAQWTRPGLSFGIALPTDVKTDFIGQISAESKSKWAGVALGPSMVNKLLLTSYPNGQTITNSIRLAPRKSSPPVYDGASKMIPIASGSYVNATHWVSTFLCSACITGSPLSFTAAETAGEAKLGWALANGAVADAGNPAARLGMHSGGQGTMGLNLAPAKSAKYDTWAALAKGV